MRAHEYISIEHLGFVEDGKEDTSSEAAKAWAAGGKLVVSKGEIPDMGYYAYFKDSEGNLCCGATLFELFLIYMG